MENTEAKDGIVYPQDFSLDVVDIVTDSQKVYKLKNLVIELSFFEDIYAFACSGYVILKDAVGLVETLKLDGTEFINIAYGKTRSLAASAKIIRTFRIYKIGNRKPSGNTSFEYFTIYFCSEEMLLSEQLKLSKGFKGQQISDIIKTILTDKNSLNVRSQKIQYIEPTFGTYDFVIPRLKPFEAISWLSTYARPIGGQGSDMLFFETNDGYNFKSLQSMFIDAPYGTFTYKPANINSEDLASSLNTVLEYEFVKTFDSLEATESGVYSSKLITIDPLTRTQKITTFNKNELNGYGASGQGTNRLGKKQTEMYDSSLKLAFGNSGEKDKAYIKQNASSVAKDIYIETSVPNRTAQIALANYTVVKIIIPGDTGITAGRTINFHLYSNNFDPDSKKREFDKFFSGKYLVTAVRHVIQSQGVFQTILELAKESLKSPYPSPNYSSLEYKETLNA
jgi:hypothetical protein